MTPFFQKLLKLILIPPFYLFFTYFIYLNVLGSIVAENFQITISNKDLFSVFIILVTAFICVLILLFRLKKDESKSTVIFLAIFAVVHFLFVCTVFFKGLPTNTYLIIVQTTNILIFTLYIYYLYDLGSTLIKYFKSIRKPNIGVK